MVTDMVQTLRENCHCLADSLCTYSTDTPNTAALNGARYFMLSGAHISDVVQHVTTTYSKVKYHCCTVPLSKSQGLIRTSLALLFCMLITRCAQVGVVILFLKHVRFGIDHPKAISAICISDSQISVYSIGIRSGNEPVVSFSLL